MVLRLINNILQDITPPALSEFFAPCSITIAHVLLDPKGKTLSHAYVELPMHTARQALRSVQNKTLGKGKRMRGVTVTMSSQSELMRAVRIMLFFKLSSLTAGFSSYSQRGRDRSMAPSYPL